MRDFRIVSSSFVPFLLNSGIYYRLSRGSFIKLVKKLLTTYLWPAQGREGGGGKNE
jgi:hypothetical protein